MSWLLIELAVDTAKGMNSVQTVLMDVVEP